MSNRRTNLKTLAAIAAIHAALAELDGILGTVDGR